MVAKLSVCNLEDGSNFDTDFQKKQKSWFPVKIYTVIKTDVVRYICGLSLQ